MTGPRGRGLARRRVTQRDDKVERRRIVTAEFAHMPRGVRRRVDARVLKQLGCDAYALEEGTAANVRVAPVEKPRLHALVKISAGEMRTMLSSGECARASAIMLRAELRCDRNRILKV